MSTFVSLHINFLKEEQIKFKLNRLNTPFFKSISCQEVFLDNAGSIGQNIARNQALKENVFMMVVCIELRIPLFLVGKPGSSKSLAKKIIMNAMQGKSSQGSLFKEYKAVSKCVSYWILVLISLIYQLDDLF